MAQSYYHSVRINSRDVDANGHCKASAVLGHLQEAATQAAEHGGFGRELLLKECGAFWMLTRVWYRLERPLFWDETITIHTWHRGGRGAVSYRDYDILSGDRVIGEGVAAWVLADVESRKLVKLNDLDILQSTSGEELCKAIKLAKIKPPCFLKEAERRVLRYSDTDINGHVNNTRYADFACDVLNMDKLAPGLFLSQMQIGYLGECYPGECLRMMEATLDTDNYVCGLDEEGKARFEASLRFEEYKGEQKRLCLK